MTIEEIQKLYDEGKVTQLDAYRLLPHLLAIANASQILLDYMANPEDPYDVPIWMAELERLLEELENLK